MNAMGLPTRCARICAVVALSGLLAARALVAQTAGRIEGQVRDGAGGALANADVLLSGPSLQGARTARTDREGRFWLPGLPPGAYAVTVAISGFRPETRTVLVSASGRASADFTLQPAVSEEVAVVADADRVDTTSTTGGTTYSAQVIAKLPVDRNYADVVRANPGVSTDLGQTQGRALGLTVYGATSAENAWVIDGVNTTNTAQGLQGKTLNTEFIQELEVKTGGYSAEYGGALGGVVNVVTKSGGNEFHGGAFVYYDGSGTAAQQLFTSDDELTTAMRWADYDRLDYGADLGGYFVKDRLWFFGAYDRVTLNGDVSRVVAVPLVSTSDRFPLDSADTLYSGKLTWNAATSTSLVGTVFADPSDGSGAAANDPRQDPQIGRYTDNSIINPNPTTWYSARTVGGTDFALRAQQLLGASGLFTLQGSRHRNSNSLTASNLIRITDMTCPPDQPPGTPDHPCQLPEFANAVEGGFGIIDGQLDHNVAFRNQIRGDGTFSSGAHELKAGAAYEYAGSDATYSASGGQTVTKWNQFGVTYYDHLYNAVSFRDLTPAGGVKVRARDRHVGAYAEDSWRLRDGLTLNLGLRWDGEDLLAFDGTTAISLRNEWQPRLGVVWDPWANGKTKLYAFAGRYYYSMPTIGTAFANHRWAVLHVYNFDPTSLVPDPTVPNQSTHCDLGCGPTGTGTDAFYPVDRNLRGMYQDEATLGVERMLDPSLMVGLKGTYRRLGNAIEDRCDFDYAVPGLQATYCAMINPGSGEKYASGNAPVCNLLDFEFYACTPTGAPTPEAKRTYRGIELLARKTLGARLWIQASYVYSSLIGNYDGAVYEATRNTQPGITEAFNAPPLWHDAYGRLFLDQPHRFRLDGYWNTPIALGLGVQFFAASGAPFDKLGYYGYNYSTFLVPRGSAGRLPTQWDANVNLSYPITVGPATVTVLAYAFNVFNNQFPIAADATWTTGPAEGYPATVYDPNQGPVNENYGKYTGRMSPRSFRAAIRVTF